MRDWIRLVVAISAITTASAYPQNKKHDPEQIGNRNVGSGVNFYSLEKEIALGKQLAQEVERSAKLVEDPIAAEFVNRLATTLARNSDLKVPVTAKIIDSDQVNAFALPGGFLFVNSGLILRADAEAELACAMAHEIAHVAARHGTRQASRAGIANIATLPLIFLGGWPGYIARQGAGAAIPVTFLKFSRGFEEEADLLGLQYVYKAGYDPAAFVDFFEKMEAMEKRRPGTVSAIFRSHPKLSDRIKATQRNLETMLRQQPQYVVTTSEFASARDRLGQLLNRRLAAPEKPGPSLRKRPAAEENDERPTLKRRN